MSATSQPNEATRARPEEERRNESGPRLVTSAPAALAGGDPYARVLAIGDRPMLARVLGTLAFFGLAIEIHALLRLWVAMLSAVAHALDTLPAGWMGTFVRLLLVGAAGVLGVFGVASLGFRGRREAVRIGGVVGAVAALVAVVVALVAGAVAFGPRLPLAWQNELLVESRALVAGVFAGIVAYASLASIRALSRNVRIAIAVALGVLVMLPVSVLGHVDLRIAADKNDQPIDVDLDEPPPPPEPPPPAPTAEPEPEPPKPEPKPLPPTTAPAPAPAPAQAGAVLAAKPDDKPLDFTNTIITGTANDYAGGITTSNGTASTAVRSTAARPDGVPGGVGTGPAMNAPPPQAQAPSRARNAGLMSHDWRCPFPPEADTAQIDEAVVTLQISVRADGTPGAVRIMSDPGNGFGRMAYQCAMRQRFVTALDRDGNAIAGVVIAPVHFNR